MTSLQAAYRIPHNTLSVIILSHHFRDASRHCFGVTEQVAREVIQILICRIGYLLSLENVTWLPFFEKKKKKKIVAWVEIDSKCNNRWWDLS